MSRRRYTSPTLPSIDVIRNALRYDPDTGLFFWRQTGKGRNKDLTVPAGNLKRDGYYSLMLEGRNILLHRLAWAYVHGRWPAEFIDHINRNPADNRIVNLREATNTENLRNSVGKRVRQGLKGTYKNKDKWSARICVDNRTIRLGTYATVEEAHAAYAAAASRYFGEFAHTG